MIHGVVSALRAQVSPNFAGGSIFTIAVRTAKRKHLRIASRQKAMNRNKLKREEEKKEEPFVPYKLKLLQQGKPKVREDEMAAKRFKTPPVDDVWIQKYYQKPVLPLAEAVSFLRESMHPSVYDNPTAQLSVDIELNMRLEKEGKNLDSVKGIIYIPFLESSNKVVRSVVAICKNPEDQQKALAAGADIVGSTNIINAMEKGELKVDSFDHLVCHQDSILELVKLRGILKKKFPDKKKRNLGMDVVEMVTLFAKGYEYESEKQWGETQWANVKFTPGRLDTPDEHIIENLRILAGALITHRPPEFGPFINKAVVSAGIPDDSYRVDLYALLPPIEVSKKTSTGKSKADGADALESEERTVSAASG